MFCCHSNQIYWHQHAFSFRWKVPQHIVAVMWVYDLFLAQSCGSYGGGDSTCPKVVSRTGVTLHLRTCGVTFLQGSFILIESSFRLFFSHTRTKYDDRTNMISSVQFSRSVMSDSLRPHKPQYARPPCPSPTPRVHSNSCPSSQWCHPAISSSVVPVSSSPQSFPASGAFQMSQLFASGGQSIGVSASALVLPTNTQDWSPLGWTGWISLQSKGLSRVFSNTTVQKHQFFGTPLSSQSNSHIHIWPLEKP